MLQRKHRDVNTHQLVLTYTDVSASCFINRPRNISTQGNLRTDTHETCKWSQSPYDPLVASPTCPVFLSAHPVWSLGQRCRLPESGPQLRSVHLLCAGRDTGTREFRSAELLGAISPSPQCLLQPGSPGLSPPKPRDLP